MDITEQEYRIGDRTVVLRLHEAGGRDIFMISVHDDETTCVEAGLEVMEEKGGSLLNIEHTGEREVMFQQDGSRYRFDPNRIFSEQGARATLEYHSETDAAVPRAAVERVRSFAEHLVETYVLADRSFIVALHNTMGELSADMYGAGGEHAESAAGLHLDEGCDPEDFFYVTEPILFERLASGGFNVVLQDNRDVLDDGSLSVWAAEKGIPYVNVEAKLGRPSVQSSMLREVYRLVQE